jgi:hypothetical protein
MNRGKDFILVEERPEFAAGAHFVENHSETDDLRIVLLGMSFTNCFVPVVEGRVPATEMISYRVESRATDRELVAEIGTVQPAKLSQILWLMKRQPHGETGPLRTKYAQNIFPVRCIHGDILNVCVSYHANEAGWHVIAIRKDHQEICFPGAQILVPKA